MALGDSPHRVSLRRRTCWRNALHDYAPYRNCRQRARHHSQRLLRRKPWTKMLLRPSAHGRRARGRWERLHQRRRRRYPSSRRAYRCLVHQVQRIVLDGRRRHNLHSFHRPQSFRRTRAPMDGTRSLLAHEAAVLVAIQTMITHTGLAPRMDSMRVITRAGPPICRTTRPLRRLNC